MCMVHEANLKKHLDVWLGVRLTWYGVLGLGPLHGAMWSVASGQRPAAFCVPAFLCLIETRVTAHIYATNSNLTRIICYSTWVKQWLNTMNERAWWCSYARATTWLETLRLCRSTNLTSCLCQALLLLGSETWICRCTGIVHYSHLTLRPCLAWQQTCQKSLEYTPRLQLVILMKQHLFYVSRRRAMRYAVSLMLASAWNTGGCG